MKKIKVPLEISARHLHLTKEDSEILFGKDYQLTVLKLLSQEGMFAAKETVKVEFGGKFLEEVRIVGPVRGYTQLELSLSDARLLGVSVPVRLSGNIKGTLGFKIIGPVGELEKEEGALVAQRHVHLNFFDAEQLGLKNGEKIKVKAGLDGERELIFKDVILRVEEGASLACHLDTDEGNAAGLKACEYGELLV
jgi:putative phosphotransacetylase